MKYARSYRLAFNDAPHLLSVRFVVEDAESEGVIRGVESARRPAHKLRKMEEKSGLDLVLFGGSLGPDRLLRSWNEHEQAGERKDPGEQPRHHG